LSIKRNNKIALRVGWKICWRRHHQISTWRRCE